MYIVIVVLTDIICEFDNCKMVEQIHSKGKSKSEILQNYIRAHFSFLAMFLLYLNKFMISIIFLFILLELSRGCSVLC